MKQKIILTKGLPASGKTTWAKELLKLEPRKWKRINKDDLRSMLDGGEWSKENEDFIIMARNILVGVALGQGYNVVVDDTNLSDKHYNTMVELFGKDADIEYKDFTDVPLKECIRRDFFREYPVGEKVIRRMAKMIPKKEIEKYPRKVELPDAILCDLDGTLALFGNENAYDRDFSKDIINENIGRLLNFQKHAGFKIIIVSGRKGESQKVTEKWLKDNGILYDAIFMRKVGDNRKDSIIKEEIFDANIRDKYNVEFVLDDRNQVVELWRKLGLTCLQVADGDF